jgi:putative flippase GtrA
MKNSRPIHCNLLRWLKFNAVGGIGISVQLTALVLLKSEAHLPISLATALAVEAAVTHNFFWHERFTWADRQNSANRIKRFLKFNFTAGAFSIAGNTLLTVALANGLHIHYFLANCIAIALCSLGNFLVNDRFVFREARVR